MLALAKFIVPQNQVTFYFYFVSCTGYENVSYSIECKVRRFTFKLLGRMAPDYLSHLICVLLPSSALKTLEFYWHHRK